MSQRPMEGEGDWGDPVPGSRQPPPGSGYGPPPGPPPGQPMYQYQQPGYGAPPPHQGPVKVNSFLVPAILATLFCCLPTGIAAIVFAAQANTKAGQGDLAGAQASATKARLWTWVSVGLGLVVGLLIFIGELAQA